MTTTEITDSKREGSSSIGGGGEGKRLGDYWLSEGGQVYRGALHIGTRDSVTGRVTYEAGMSKYRIPVGKLLAQSSTGSMGEAEAELEAEPESVAEVNEASVVDAFFNKYPEMREGEWTEAEARADWPSGAPECDWRGDLTPEFVAWYFEEYPQRARVRYGRRASVPAVAGYFNASAEAQEPNATEEEQEA